VAEKTKPIKRNLPAQQEKPDQPAVIFMDEKSNRPVSLVTLGVLAVIMGFLSKTPLMAQTILSSPADIMLIFGFLGIVVGLIMNYRKKHPSEIKKTK
jgi:hypothetical protein